MPSRFLLWEKTPADRRLPEAAFAKIRLALETLEEANSDLSQFSWEVRLAVRQYLVDTRCGAEVMLRVVEGSAVLWLAQSVQVQELDLSVRTGNCLSAASIYTLEDLLHWTPARLMELPNFGRKCLSEVSELRERLGYGGFEQQQDSAMGLKSLRLQNEAAPLAYLLNLNEVLPAGDLAARLQGFGWNILADLAVYSLSELVRLAGLTPAETAAFQDVLDPLWLKLPVGLPLWFVQHADVLSEAFKGELEQLQTGVKMSARLIRTESALTVQEEIRQAIPSRYDERKRRIVMSLLGLGGEEPLTLEEVAARQSPPMTRERIRQVAMPVTAALEDSEREWPQLVRALDSLKAAAPCRLQVAQQALLDSGILQSPMSLEAILQLANRAGLMTNVQVDSGWLLDDVTAASREPLRQAAGKLSGRWGVAYWPKVLAACPLGDGPDWKELLPNAVWLDEAREYAVLPARENSLANRLARILKAAPRLSLTDAYRGAFRDQRMIDGPLPEELFAAFCKLWPWCFVEGDEVVAGKGLPSSEASTDDLLVLLLEEFGRPVRRYELMEAALKEGFKSDHVTYSLSFSNVIAMKNGFFAVVGDRLLSEYAEGRLQPELETLVLAPVRDETTLVPDEHDPMFAPLLMAAVEARMTALGLSAPFSASELALTTVDRDRLLAWGKTATWDGRRADGYYDTATLGKVQKRAALGLSFLLFAAEAVRRSEDTGSIWPAIEAALGEPQCKLFLARSGVPKPMLREAVESACRTFGLRHGFEDVGDIWVRTLALQSGLQCGHVHRLAELIGLADHLQCVGAAMLLDTKSPNLSLSFRIAWKLLNDVRQGKFVEADALARLSADVWLMPFGAGELLRQCRRAAVPERERAELERDAVYRYFEPPMLRWDSTEPTLEYRLNTFAPPWRTSNTLTFIAEDPFRRERLAIEEGRWALRDGLLQVPIVRRARAGFRFKLMQGKESATDDWLEAGLSVPDLFVFFRASGGMVLVADDVPQNEDLVLMHALDLQVSGLEHPLRFQIVLGGGFRLLRLRAGEVANLALLTADGEALWSCLQVEAVSVEKASPEVLVRGGKWGARVQVTLPSLPFAADFLRLNSGEQLPLEHSGNHVTLRLSPGIAAADVGFVRGNERAQRRSVRVVLRHGGGDFGAALETIDGWETLDGLSTIDAAVLRTQRLRAQVVGNREDACWMEGSRTLAGLQRWGNLVTGVQGLGERLDVVRGTYNGSKVQVCAAAAVTDGGFWRGVQPELDGGWSASLPFEEALESAHELWVWSEQAALPQPIPRAHMQKDGFMLRWSYPVRGKVFGWAFSVAGARLGSILAEDTLDTFAEHLRASPWPGVAGWLRWWHVPVHRFELRESIATLSRSLPVETVKAWTLSTGVGHVFDELRSEAWAAAARTFLWEWTPKPEQAVELVQALGIWSANCDPVRAPSLDAINLLTRISPMMLVTAAEQSLPLLFPYPKAQLTFMLKLMLESINPNAAETSFRLNDLYDRYARGESRLDGNFIAKSLVSVARAMLRGEAAPKSGQDNLRIALHQPGLRELIAVALLRDTIERWERGQEL